MTVSTADTFTPTGGKTTTVAQYLQALPGSPDYVGPQQFMVLDASGIKDTKNPANGAQDCCWLQFYYLTAYVTGTDATGKEVSKYIDPTMDGETSTGRPWPQDTSKVTVDPAAPQVGDRPQRVWEGELRSGRAKYPRR